MIAFRTFSQVLVFLATTDGANKLEWKEKVQKSNKEKKNTPYAKMYAKIIVLPSTKAQR